MIVAAIFAGTHDQSSSRESAGIYTTSSCVDEHVQAHRLAGSTLCRVAWFQTQFSPTHSSVIVENRANIDGEYLIQNDSRNDFLNIRRNVLHTLRAYAICEHADFFNTVMNFRPTVFSYKHKSTYLLRNEDAATDSTKLTKAEPVMILTRLKYCRLLGVPRWYGRWVPMI